MARMMQERLIKEPLPGLRGRLGAAEMGGKTGTTNSNADFLVLWLYSAVNGRRFG